MFDSVVKSIRLLPNANKVKIDLFTKQSENKVRHQSDW